MRFVQRTGHHQLPGLAAGGDDHPFGSAASRESSSQMAMCISSTSLWRCDKNRAVLQAYPGPSGKYHLHQQHIGDGAAGDGQEGIALPQVQSGGAGTFFVSGVYGKYTLKVVSS